MRSIIYTVRRETKAYMSWIEQAVEDHVDDERRYDSSIEEDYRKALETAGRWEGVDAVKQLGKLILGEIRNGDLPDPEWVRNRGRGICNRLASQSGDTSRDGKIR